ncbi:MAG: hypothetical protein M1820_001898 [Bogoriella megaspora]|nr:MAG: hypothetical protein M1820_001898 [Bogoriella megaspora]
MASDPHHALPKQTTRMSLRLNTSDRMPSKWPAPRRPELWDGKQDSTPGIRLEFNLGTTYAMGLLYAYYFKHPTRRRDNNPLIIIHTGQDFRHKSMLGRIQVLQSKNAAPVDVLFLPARDGDGKSSLARQTPRWQDYIDEFVYRLRRCASEDYGKIINPHRMNVLMGFSYGAVIVTEGLVQMSIDFDKLPKAFSGLLGNTKSRAMINAVVLDSPPLNLLSFTRKKKTQRLGFMKMMWSRWIFHVNEDRNAEPAEDDRSIVRAAKVLGELTRDRVPVWVIKSLNDKALPSEDADEVFNLIQPYWPGLPARFQPKSATAVEVSHTAFGYNFDTYPCVMREFLTYVDKTSEEIRPGFLS